MAVIKKYISNEFVIIGGNASQFLKGDGSLDTSIYVTGGPYLPVAGGIMNGPTYHGNNVKSLWGSGNELSIFHDGTDAYIDNVLGNLKVSSDVDFSGTITADGYDSQDWATAYEASIYKATVTGSSNKTLTLDREDGGTVVATWQDNTDSTFTFTQGVSSVTWNIQHNLGKFPSITVIDSAGTVVTGQYTYNDINNVTLTFSAPFAGTAYLN